MKSEPKFTEGEWRVEDTSIVTDDICIAVIEDDGGYEAEPGERDANANLIAAAPDLYRELAHLVSLMEPKENAGGGLGIPGLATLNGARKALSKANP